MHYCNLLLTMQVSYDGTYAVIQSSVVRFRVDRRSCGVAFSAEVDGGCGSGMFCGTISGAGGIDGKSSVNGTLGAESSD